MCDGLKTLTHSLFLHIVSWDVLRTRRVLSLYNVYGDSALQVLIKGTSLNSYSALLALKTNDIKKICSIDLVTSDVVFIWVNATKQKTCKQFVQWTSLYLIAWLYFFREIFLPIYFTCVYLVLVKQRWMGVFLQENPGNRKWNRTFCGTYKRGNILTCLQVHLEKSEIKIWRGYKTNKSKPAYKVR